MHIHFHVQKAASRNVCICMIYINEQELETSPVNKDQRVRTVKKYSLGARPEKLPGTTFLIGEATPSCRNYQSLGLQICMPEWVSV